MAAIQTDSISVTLVQNTISVFSTSSVGGLIAKAKVGGTSGYAFKIYETYGASANGYLLAGAEPYWNMWSNKIPAEWDVSNGTAELRLKRNALNANGGYDFRLGDFGGYDHAAVQPQFSVATSFNFTGGAGAISWLAHFHQIKLPADITHILAKVTIGANVQTLLMPLADIIDSTPEISGYSINFTGVSETSGTAQLYASNAQGTEVATLNNIVPTRNFTINHLAQYAFLARGVGAPQIQDLTIFGNIIVPSGSGSIQIAAGTTELTGITIRISASSTVYSGAFFNLYLQQTGESDVFVGSYSAAASDPVSNTDLQDIYVTLNSAAAAGDNLAFLMTDVSPY